jgi:hypothetical protein
MPRGCPVVRTFPHTGSLAQLALRTHIATAPTFPDVAAGVERRGEARQEVGRQARTGPAWHGLDRRGPAGQTATTGSLFHFHQHGWFLAPMVPGRMEDAAACDGAQSLSPAERDARSNDVHVQDRVNSLQRIEGKRATTGDLWGVSRGRTRLSLVKKRRADCDRCTVDVLDRRLKGPMVHALTRNARPREICKKLSAEQRIRLSAAPDRQTPHEARGCPRRWPMHHREWASELKENGVFTGHPTDTPVASLLPGRAQLAM